MLNVLYLHNSSEISGGERSLLALWDHLDRTRFNIVLVLPSEGLLADEARRRGIDVGFLEVPSWRPWNAVGLWRAFRQMRGWVLSREIDLIHSYAPRNDVLASVVARASKIPVLWHGRNLLMRRETDVTRLLSFMADALICNSRAVAQRFDGCITAASKVQVIVNGVDVEFFTPGNKEAAKTALGLKDRIVVGVVSNLSKRKGVDDFLRVAAQVSVLMPDVFFIVVGGVYGDRSSDRVNELRGLAAELGIADKICWTGFQEDVRPYVQALDVLCHVTVKEACSRAILEAMATGVCVVAFNDGGTPELIEDGVSGCLVPSGNWDGMVGCVVKLLRDEALRGALARQSRMRVEKFFDVRINARETMLLYERCTMNKTVVR